MFSILAMPLILAIGFVLDLAQANRYRSELQNVADAVALSAVNGLPLSDTQGQIDGKTIYDSMMASIRAGLLSDNVTITFQKTPVFKAFIAINATAKGIFGNNIGLGPIRYEVKSQAVLSANHAEVAMVVDLSGSMTTSRMRALGNAMTEFDNAVKDSITPTSSIRIAVIPFAQTVTLPTYAANWLNDPKEAIAAAAMPGICFEAKDTTLDVSSATPSGLALKLISNPARCMPEQAFALTDSFTKFRAMATAFKNPPAWRSTWRGLEKGPYWGTAIYLGASWANRFLSQSWASSLPASAAPRSPNKVSKFAIIMTDGEQLSLDSYSVSQADSMLLSTCNNLRANAVEVFTVGFAVTAASKTLLERCAGGAKNYIAANSEAELKTAFERIGRAVAETIPRLVY